MNCEELIGLLLWGGQRDGSAVAVLESTGGKGSVMVNGLTVKKSTNCVLNSGDEVVFGALGNHAYVSFSYQIRHSLFLSSFLFYTFFIYCHPPSNQFLPITFQ